MNDANRDAGREGAALRLLALVRQRTALDEATGILMVWDSCSRVQARATLRAAYGEAGETVEAARLLAVVDSTADGGADPDWE
jgi:hypothetical protein